MRKFAFAVAVLGLSLMAAKNASADIMTTVDSWRNAGSFHLGDKTFTFGSESGLNNAATIEIHQLGGGQYSVVLGSLIDNMPSATADLKYSVAIDAGMMLYFGQAQLDVVGSGIPNAFTVTKSIYSDSGFSNLKGSIVHTDSNAPGPIDISPLTTIYVDDALSVTTGHLSSVTNTFSQVPEPSTFALLGLGGIGLAIRAWRQRRQAKVVA